MSKEINQMMAEALENAKELVTGDRQKDYGTPRESFGWRENEAVLFLREYAEFLKGFANSFRGACSFEIARKAEAVLECADRIERDHEAGENGNG